MRLQAASATVLALFAAASCATSRFELAGDGVSGTLRAIDHEPPSGSDVFTTFKVTVRVGDPPVERGGLTGGFSNQDEWSWWEMAFLDERPLVCRREPLSVVVEAVLTEYTYRDLAPGLVDRTERHFPAVKSIHLSAEEWENFCKQTVAPAHSNYLVEKKIEREEDVEQRAGEAAASAGNPYPLLHLYAKKLWRIHAGRGAVACASGTLPELNGHCAWGRWSEIVRIVQGLRPRPELTASVKAKLALLEKSLDADNAEDAATLCSLMRSEAPWEPVVRYNCSFVDAIRGDYFHARWEMQSFLDLTPDAPEAATAREQIQTWEKQVKP